MLTLFFQCILALLRLSFGAAALRVAAHLPAARPSTRLWRVAGVAFCLVGGYSLLHSVLAVAAFNAGPGSRLWDGYIVWAPALNHSRALAVTALFPLLALGACGKLGTGPTLLVRALAVLFGGAVLGALLGAWEGPLRAAVHYRSGALLSTVELITVLVVLFWLLVRDRADRLLWTALALYAISLVMSTVWTAAMMGLDSPGVWAPSPRQMHIIRAGLGAGMVLVALRRLAQARRNAAVPGLLEDVGGRTIAGVAQP